MHCFGLPGIRGVAEGVARLGIPDQTVRRLTCGCSYLRDACRDVGVFSVDLYAFGRLTRPRRHRTDRLLLTSTRQFR